MRSVLLLIIFILSTSLSWSQHYADGYEIYLDKEDVGIYPVVKSKSSLFVPIVYATPIISNPIILNKIKGKIIYKIDLVYSEFTATKDIDQLNRQRLTALYSYAPELFGNDLIQWNLIKQTKCKSDADAKLLFHGFVFSFRESPSEGTMNLEIDYLKKAIKEKVKISDSTIFKVFNRHKDWKNVLIVCDVTGSMSPYTSQLMLWFKLQTAKKNVKSFVFFNDGDRKYDYDKAIGSTGGIYSCTADKFEVVEETIIKAMSNGYGGDTPENNLEALISGIKKYPECDDIIMIADNYASPRDMSLLASIKKPIRIILCGTNDYYNSDYLDIALQTGGSLHTIEKDVVDLLKRNEGEIIKIGKQKYKVTKGKLVKYKES